MKLRLNLIGNDSIPQILLNILALKLINWKHHVSDIAIKLNRANALLFKIRNFLNINTLKTIYYAIFDLHINSANVIWAQNFNAVSRVSILQKKALRTIRF